MKLFPDFHTLVSIGGFNIRYYAVCILLGALFAYQLGRYRFKKLGYAPNILSDYFFGVMVTGIIGARIWYVIFMWKELYASHPEDIIAIWHGGLAIQGGLFTGLIYSVYYFKKHQIDFFVAGDAIMPGVLIAQACGRWGNFFNQEAFGGEVSLSFLKGLHLPSFIVDHMYIEGAYHHPTFLYESVGNVILFLLIILVVKRISKKNGIQFFSYFVGYGIVRFFVEGMRTDSLMLGSLRMAQIISLIFIVCGIAGILYIHFKREDKQVDE
ncbi:MULTISPECIES: prolipoprotein diacylglyceryl transferase [Kandleria]|jgi:phosphatidylglycerol:prolipoprotein diacylglycerol transferase|uniref:prolipoprotein diacylglyceryl transferase n=1 Tax=Kandleria TaxID=1279388 RepID=UPI000887F168|nr:MULTISPECIES: prolipoprotein diacylglyceryl transferase [Kandleria]MBP3276980.1 prolipoprotein diacylglyceryl transferase [Kandleria sp.]SDM05147.1 phosphatidylglycerol:prolipoprotein diacylglycerol transferase [Kandleria vitulina]SEJ23868.1 phosphatidylglycerol:prolipoprotein diacylglycerol transferase [Kandleria vitulina]HAD24053.1 prolipoprotein diacylglyceryl transferase [Kandleria vitulina]HBG67323.1 prolipoprotein diacylglyceryl transferase [Kandleria vitulina]